MPTVTVSLVVFNGARYLPLCLDSLRAQTFQDFQIIVIDNASGDGSADIIERDYIPVFGNRMRLVRNKENLGFARAHNQAILWSDSPYVLCLNQDMVLDTRFLEEAVRALQAHPGAAAIAPKLYRWKFKEYGLTPDSLTRTLDSMGLMLRRSQQCTDLGAGEEDRGQYDALGSVFGASGALPVYRRTALDDVRYGDEFFDADFHTYKEDVDLAYRLRWRGWSVISVPAARAWHDRSVGTHVNRRARSVFSRFHSYKNHLFLLIKNVSARNAFALAPWIVWYELRKFAYILFVEPGTLAALGIAVKRLPVMLRKRRHIMARRTASDADLRAWMT